MISGLCPESGSHSAAARALPPLLYQLQELCAETRGDWQAIEYAMLNLLVELCEPPSPATAVFDNASHPPRVVWCDVWWMELGEAVFTREVITLEREGHLLAAICPSEDARLRLAVYCPLDAHSLALLTRLAAHPHPRLGVAMRESNWALAVDTAADIEQFLAGGRGEPYLSHWSSGLGNGSARALREQAVPLAPRLVEAQLQIFRRYRRQAAAPALS
ncbi:MAG: hypothetical protein ACK5HY_09765 [Parahaliea sp.]